jgi:hypothetical protein
MQRQHAVRLNLDLFYDYRTNVPLYPAWQRLLRERQPQTLIFWGQSDIFFTPEGGDAYLADLPTPSYTGSPQGISRWRDHLDYIATQMKRFHAAL